MNPNSEMDPLEPIPSPPGHLLREFCHRALPVLAFVAAGAGAAYLWGQRFTGTRVPGEVEPIQANITTLEGGTLVQLHVERWQEVTNGQPIATLQVIDPDAVGRSVDILRSELYLLRSRMSLDESRNDQNLESLRVRWLEARVQLATSRVQLENAKRDLERVKQLFEAKVVANSEFDDAQAVHDALVVEVAERSQLADGLDDALKRLDASNREGRSTALDVLGRSLSAQETQLQQEGTVHLRAPMDGIVQTLAATPGERIAAGAIIATVSSPKSSRVIAYVRQPLALEPQPGMPVEIRTRGVVRQVGQSEIANVSRPLDLISSTLRLPGFDSEIERGLAFSVPIPADLNVHPGELVDVVVLSHGK